MFVSCRAPYTILAAVFLLFASPVGIARAMAEASRVRILIVEDRSKDSLDKQQGEAALKQIRSSLRRNLRKQGLAGRYTLDVLRGPDLTAEAVLNYYRQLRTRPSEALVFVGLLHGATHPELGHVLAIGKSFLLRSDLRAAMLEHNTRLIVILTDACASIVGRKPLNSRRIRAPRNSVSRRPRAGNGSVVRQLFFRHTGVVDINAARTGYVAVGVTTTRGTQSRHCSPFAQAFCQLIDQPARRVVRAKDGLVTWREFYRALDRETRQLAAARARRYQPTEAFSLAQRKPSTKSSEDSLPSPVPIHGGDSDYSSPGRQR